MGQSVQHMAALAPLHDTLSAVETTLLRAHLTASIAAAGGFEKVAIGAIMAGNTVDGRRGRATAAYLARTAFCMSARQIDRITDGTWSRHSVASAMALIEDRRDACENYSIRLDDLLSRLSELAGSSDG